MGTAGCILPRFEFEFKVFPFLLRIQAKGMEEPSPIRIDAEHQQTIPDARTIRTDHSAKHILRLRFHREFPASQLEVLPVGVFQSKRRLPLPRPGGIGFQREEFQIRIFRRVQIPVHRKTICSQLERAVENQISFSGGGHAGEEQKKKGEFHIDVILSFSKMVQFSKMAIHPGPYFSPALRNVLLSVPILRLTTAPETLKKGARS